MDLDEFKEKIKEIFSVDNILKYKWIILIFILVITPLILYFSIEIGIAFKMRSQQESKLTSHMQRVGEENLNLTYYDPISRDLNSSEQRIIYYNISYSKNPDNEYLLPDSAYWVKITNISLIVLFKVENSSNTWFTSVVAIHNVNVNLSFGDSHWDSFDYSGAFTNYIANGSDKWDSYKIKIELNLTHSYDLDYRQQKFEFYGNVINFHDLVYQNLDEGKRVATMVVVYYISIFGLFSLLGYFYLRKKKYSFILPY